MTTRVLLAFMLACLLLSFVPGRQAQACCVCNATIAPVSRSEWNDPWPKGSTPVINTHIDNEFNAHETWLVKFLLEDNILPAMMLMAEQLTVGAIQQIGILGTFFDAKQQLETQRTVQTLKADLHRDYHPSVGMCEFGSGIKSLAATERLADYNGMFLAQRALDRHLGSAGTSGYGGEAFDKENRLNQFAADYCDPKDNNGGLEDICKTAAAVSDRYNKDIDFSRTLGTPWTLEINFGNRGGTALTDDEADIFALQNNLFGHRVFTRIPPELFNPHNFSGAEGGINSHTSPEAWTVREGLMDMRALTAKRGVAENSYSQLVADKAEGTGASTPFLYEMMKELGVGAAEDKAADLEELLGKKPSYYAQMEMLTKKIYQNPDFYTNLYDTPANVGRKEAAIGALELIQKFDMFKSNLRAEANLSVMLETAVMELQTRVENEFPEATAATTAQPLRQLDNLGGSNAQP